MLKAGCRAAHQVRGIQYKTKWEVRALICFVELHTMHFYPSPAEDKVAGCMRKFCLHRHTRIFTQGEAATFAHYSADQPPGSHWPAANNGGRERRRWDRRAVAQFISLNRRRWWEMQQTSSSSAQHENRLNPWRPRGRSQHKKGRNTVVSLLFSQLHSNNTPSCEQTLNNRTLPFGTTTGWNAPSQRLASHLPHKRFTISKLDNMNLSSEQYYASRCQMRLQSALVLTSCQCTISLLQGIQSPTRRRTTVIRYAFPECARVNYKAYTLRYNSHASSHVIKWTADATNLIV